MYHYTRYPICRQTLPSWVQSFINANPFCYSIACPTKGYKTASEKGTGCNLQFQECVAEANITNYGTMGSAQIQQLINCAQSSNIPGNPGGGGSGPSGPSPES